MGNGEWRMGRASGYVPISPARLFPIFAPPQKVDNLPRPGMAFGLRLLEDGAAVAVHLEAPLARGDQRHIGTRIFRTNLGRQTDGPRFVVSKRAVFDRDLDRKSVV